MVREEFREMNRLHFKHSSESLMLTDSSSHIPRFVVPADIGWGAKCIGTANLQALLLKGKPVSGLG
jgi:hypothetical protein